MGRQSLDQYPNWSRVLESRLRPIQRRCLKRPLLWRILSGLSCPGQNRAGSGRKETASERLESITARRNLLADVHAREGAISRPIAASSITKKNSAKPGLPGPLPDSFTVYMAARLRAPTTMPEVGVYKSFFIVLTILATSELRGQGSDAEPTRRDQIQAER